MKKYCFIDDSVSGVGGTSLTLDAIVEPERENVDFVPTREFSLKQAFSEYDFFILGNITSFDKNSYDSIMTMMEGKPFVKIEFDYGYCVFRGRIPHQMLGGEKCNCMDSRKGNKELIDLYDSIKSYSDHVFYMSEDQMKIHNDDLLGFDSRKKSILSSCFSSENMLSFSKLRNKTKNGRYAIIDGQGGWHTQAKGINESIKYAKSNNLNFDIIKTDTHSEMLNKLSEYKGIITLPIIHDTCPRITIEARFMGLEVITNEFSQHIREKWWKASDRQAYEYIESRPAFFWDKIKCLKY